MKQFAGLAGADRAALFTQSAQETGIPAVIIEKDFWVCWMLQQLWSLPEVSPFLIFKGGTSLSKCFNLIQRFSEDIDIGLDRTLLGFDETNGPEIEGISRKQRNKRVDALKASATAWIKGPLLEMLTARIETELGAAQVAGWAWVVQEDSDGMPQLVWTPPPSIMRRGRQRQASPSIIPPYLKRGILLEIGSRAAHWPASDHEVTPYVAQVVPQAFNEPAVPICTLEAQRTFWEKATILHVLYHETVVELEAGKPAKQRERYSRHCYDLYCIAQSPIGQTALNDFGLLEQVVTFKRKVFCSSHAKERLYEEARPGTFHFVPHPELEGFFKADYAKMQDSGMFFGAAPTWAEIMKTLARLEEQINDSH